MTSLLLRTALSRRLQVFMAILVLTVASAACSKQQETKETHLSRANELFAAAQYDKAADEYRNVLRLDPNDPVAVGRLATIYFDQGQVIQAYPLLKKAAELQPDDSALQLKLAETLMATGEYQNVRDAALRIVAKQPGQEEALVLLANTAAGLHDVDETEKLVTDLKAKDQDRAGYHLAFAGLALQRNDQARAENELKVALQLDPKSIAAHTALGNLYWSRNDLKSAEQEFKAAADAAAPRSPERVRYAVFKLRTGAAAEAKTLLEDINAKFPDYLPPRVALMQMACTEHQDADCTARVQNILAQDPTNFDALFQDGLLGLANNDAAKAVREFGFLTDTFPQNAQARYQLARGYLLLASKDTSESERRKLLDSAENRLSEAVKLNPRFDLAAIALAEMKIRKGSPASAVDLLEPIFRDRPAMVQADYLLSGAYLAQQKLDQARAVYQRVAELFPQEAQPHYLMGLVLLAQRQQSEARKEFEKTVELSPDNLPAIERLVDLDLADQQYATAIARVQKIIDKDPKSAAAWALRGKIYFAQKDFRQAEPDLLKSIQLDPTIEPAYLLLARLYIASNRQDQAIESLTGFVEKNKDAAALLQLATLHEQLGHFAAARDSYEKLLTIAPNSIVALNNLSVLYSEHLGDINKADELAKKARQNNPNEPHIADTLGWISFKKGDYGQAQQLLQESVAKLPDQPDIEFHFGMANYMLGRDEAARTALQTAAESTTEFPGKEEARKRLAILAIDPGNVNANPGDKSKLENYLREQPNDPAALVRLAALQRSEGAEDQSVKTYEKALAADPLYAPATRQLALIYSQRPNPDPKSYDLGNKAREAYPGDPEVAKALGILDYRRGFYPQAAELLKEAAAKRKDDAEALYYLGQSNRELKQWTQCTEALERALALRLPSGLAEDAKHAFSECSDAASPPNDKQSPRENTRQ